MKKRLVVPIGIVCALASLVSYAQRKIVVLGSSTAAGNSANPIDSSWARKLYAFYNKNTNDNQDTNLINLAMPGYVSHKAMYTGYPTPANRSLWPVDVDRNITKALSYHPDVIIISFPSNDVAIMPDYDMKETMDNFRDMFQKANASNVRCFITTMQPRNEMDDSRRQMLRQLTDSIRNNFGTYSVDFWTPLATADNLNNMRPEVNADNIHPNNLGHRFLYDQVVAKQLFLGSAAPLPVRLSGFAASFQNNSVALKWTAENETASTFYEVQRSSNGRDFEKLTSISVSAPAQKNQYSFTDANPSGNQLYYRLRIVEPGSTSFSSVVSLLRKQRALVLEKIYQDAASLHIDVHSSKSQAAELRILNLTGDVILKKTLRLDARLNNLVLPVGNLPSGDYIVSLTTDDDSRESKKFSRLK